MKTAVLNVSGMHCSSCSMLVTMNLDDLDGVQSVKCDHATGRTEVSFDELKVTPEKLIGEIASAGYGAELERVN